jgi:hypothetical protein
MASVPASGSLVTERAWELPAAGASLRERWAAIAPELAGHVAAVAYDPDSGQLTVCPESSVCATKTRLEQNRVIAAANKAAGRTVVSALRGLPAGRRTGARAAPIGPARTRETACEGYRRALEAHREAAPPSRVDPGVTEAVERQTAALRELSRHVFPESTLFRTMRRPGARRPERSLSSGAQMPRGISWTSRWAKCPVIRRRTVLHSPRRRAVGG